VEFITRGEYYRDQQGRDASAPEIVREAAPAPEEQYGENAVLGHVPGLAQEEMGSGQRGRRNVGVEPAQERHEEARGVLGRHEVGRSPKDQGHPQDNRQPGSKKVAKIQVRSLSGRGSLTNGTTRVTLAAGNEDRSARTARLRAAFSGASLGGAAPGERFWKKVAARETDR